MRIFKSADLDEAPCGFIVTDDAGRIAAVNNTLVRILGYRDKDDLVGRSLETVLTVAGRIFYQTHLYPLVNLHGQVQEIFLTLLKKDGDHYPAVCNAVRKQEDDIIATHFIFIPAEQRGRYEQEILEARRRAESATRENAELIQTKMDLENARLDLDKQLFHLKHVNNNLVQLGHAISHELQEPMRKIALKSDSLIQKNKDRLSGFLLEDLRNINTNSINLRAFAVNLERYISLNLVSENKTRVNLNELIERAQLAAASVDGTQDLIVQAETLPEIEGYPLQLETLFTSLFQSLLSYRSDSRPLNVDIRGQIQQTNSFRHLPNSFRYVDTLCLVFDDQGALAARAEALTDVINKRIDIRTISENLAIACSKTVAESHLGSLAASTDGRGVTTIKVTLPLLQHLPPPRTPQAAFE